LVADCIKKDCAKLRFFNRLTKQTAKILQPKEKKLFSLRLHHVQLLSPHVKQKTNKKFSYIIINV